jgi:NADPH-dependent ferric siderophore reductase
MSLTLHAPIRVRHQPRLRQLEVLRVEQLSPRMRRIVLGGPDLAGFTSAAADDHVKLFLPAPGVERPPLPTQGPEGPVWPQGAARPAMRDYTPRRYDPSAGELAIEFVLHDVDGPHGGPASEWAAQAVPGQWLGVGGPRGSMLIPEDYDAYLIAGDESALPAIARRLEEMRPGTPAIVLIEVADAAEQRYLPTAANAAITWLSRDGAPAGRTTLLAEAMRALKLPSGDVHAWIAGEIETARTLRKVLMEQSGLPRAQIHAAGYWRLGAEGAHARLDDED